VNKNKKQSLWAHLKAINNKHNECFSVRHPHLGKAVLWINRYMLPCIIFCLILIITAIATCRHVRILILVGALLCMLGAGSAQAQTDNSTSAGHFALLTPLPHVHINPSPKLVPECVIAVTVIVVGGIVYYNIYNLCKNKLGTNNPPNSPTNTTKKALVSTDVYAAWIKIGGTMSDPKNPDCGCGNSVSVGYTISTGTNGPRVAFTKGVTIMPSSGTIDNVDFSSWLQATYGLVVGSVNNFTSNGVPVASIPFIGVGNNGLITITNGSATTYTTVLQRTTDFAHWTPVTTNTVSADMPIVLMDDSAPDDNGYYRMVIVSTNGIQ
jgi:hypothetical protein